MVGGYRMNGGKENYEQDIMYKRRMKVLRKEERKGGVKTFLHP